MEIVSTYRLQFHKGFTFQDAVSIIPYLHDLGITHIYASPYLKAVAGSTHGYDVIDHSQLNPEIGSTTDYEQFIAALNQHGMSHILDTVPNHMGVDTNENAWWNDVLEFGQKSGHADYFDINWKEFAPRKQLEGCVLLPLLGEPIDQALKEELLKLKWEDDKPFICYRDGRRFPIDRHTNTNGGMAQLLAQQNYRLSWWKTAADEINYRRFFDIASLAALQMQRKNVYEDAHRFTFELIARGHVAGLRVDHPDGLLDPGEYFERLQDTFKNSCPDQAAGGEPLFVSVEKILNGDETLPDDWPVAGTSGYDFLYSVNDLFVDSANEQAMTAIYIRFTGDGTTYNDCVHTQKRKVLDSSMFSEMSALTDRLDALAQQDIGSRDFTRHQLHDALREIIACFGVYRSYVSGRGVSEADVKVVGQAVDAAAIRSPKLDAKILAFIRDSVLLRYPVANHVKPRQIEFAQRFQQLTSPVNAKGIEDSTFYIYNRLASLNEVGGDPGRFGRGPDAIHEYLLHRQSHWPLSLSTLSTHDTKRSEDVRARLNILSEMPDEWADKLDLWNTFNKPIINGIHPNDLYLMYQTLVGAWPLEPMDDSRRMSFTVRIKGYMQKALREAKLRTSWVDPDEKYEAAIVKLIESLIDPRISQTFLVDFAPFVKRVSRFGLFNSLSQTVLRLTAPGISDTYQGTELWDFSLVDPDNRRPVDYLLRRKRLEGLPNSTGGEIPRRLLANMDDGDIKLWINRQLLHCRRRMPALFLSGSYDPLKACGKHAANIFAFSRHAEGRDMIAIVPRLVSQLGMDRDWNDADWGDTIINLKLHSGGDKYRNVLTDQQVSIEPGKALNVSDVLKNFPVAVLVNIESSN